jgi:hypothetical protein
MSAKHTPGPWTANKPTQSNGRAEVHAGPMLVAQAFNWLLDAEGDEQCWADARLIAAAPDLLSVLQELEESADYWSEYDVPLGIVDRIRAAIAKATGEPA